MDVPINYLAVLVAAIASFGVGALWYSPLLFGKYWQSLMGITPEGMKSMRLSAMQAMVMGFAAALVTAYVLEHFMVFLAVTTLADALTLGFWVWLGFIAVTQLGSFLWENKPFSLFVVNAGHTLVATLVMATVLGLWN